MSDQKEFQALREEWSALVDQFLRSPNGQMAIFTLQVGEEQIFTAMLKNCADALRPTDEVMGYFKGQRHGIFFLAVEELQASNPDAYPDEDSATLACERLRDAAKDATAIIIRELARTLEAFAPKPMSDLPLPASVNQVFDLVSQSGYDVPRAFEDAPEGVNSSETETCKTRRAPDSEIRRIWASVTDTPIADVSSDQPDARTPVVEPSDTRTVPVDGANLKAIKSGNLKELLKVYSQAPSAPTSNPPPVNVSVHPASPPPAPEPGVQLGTESSIPPPVPEEASHDQLFSEDDAEIVTGELDDPDALKEVSEADLNSAFDELGPAPIKKP
ncbi:MAG: hypothetical protein PHC53_04890 [Patescibacteria group bacterium]|nr:hypothetical protein [Patescibacteria group bacterium]